MSFVIQDSVLGAVDLYSPSNSGPGAFSLLGATIGKMGRYEYPSAFVDAVDPVLGGGIFTYAQVAPIASQAVTGIAIAGNVATVTTGGAHGLSVGAVVQLAGFTPAGYNGLFTIASVPSTTTWTMNVNTFTDPRWNPANPLVVNQANLAIPTGASTVQGTYVAGIGAGQAVQFTHVLDGQGNLILQAKVWAGAVNSGLSLGVALGNALALTASSVPSNPFGGQFGWFQIGGAMVVYSAGAPAVGSQTYWNTGTGSSAGGFVTSAAVASKQMQGTQYATALGATLGTGTSGQFTLPANMAVIWGTFPLAQGAIT